MSGRQRTKETRALPAITATLKRALPDLAAEFGVRSLGIFGSTVRGEAKRGSDLDVLVEFDRAPSLFRFLELEERLGELLHARVDLVMKDALKPEIGRRILREVVPV